MSGTLNLENNNLITTGNITQTGTVSISSGTGGLISNGNLVIGSAAKCQLNQPTNNVLNVGFNTYGNYPTGDSTSNILNLSGALNAPSAIVVGNNSVAALILGVNTASDVCIGSDHSTFSIKTGMGEGSANVAGSGTAQLTITGSAISTSTGGSLSVGTGGLSTTGSLTVTGSTKVASLIQTSNTWTAGSGAGQYTFSTAAGTSPGSVQVTGGSQGGNFNFIVGSSPTAALNPIITLIYVSPFANIATVTMSPNSFSTSALMNNLYVVGGPTNFSLCSSSVLIAGTTISINWAVCGY